MRNRLSSILWGIFWLLLGVLIVGKVFDLWEFTLFFPGWWTLILIIPCGIGMIRYSFGVGSTIGFVIGILLLMTYQVPDLITTSMVWQLILPILLIVIGLNVILKSLFGVKRDLLKRARQYERREYAAVFSAQKIAPAGPFFGCETNAVFGSSVIDLRDAQITEDILISTTSVFGGVDVIVPSYANVKSSSTSIFGGTENKVKKNPDATITVYVTSVNLFGGAKIR